MARIIREFTNGNISIIQTVGSESFANEVYDTLKESDEQLAIYFMEQYRYFKICGRMMPE
ncbi:MAG: hypothetical protein MJ007_07595 [Paludibacteraceae bacterium]|nr:hypothetical protein [Paludibacteraceae bacterium]